MDNITAYIDFVYPIEWDGFACLSYWDDDGYFRNEKFASKKAMVKRIRALRDSRDLWCTSALLAEDDGNKRGDTLPSPIIKLEADKTLTEDDHLFLKKAGARLIASGSKGHVHIYIRLPEPVDSEERARLAKWVGRRLGITGRKEDGGKFESNAVLRIPGTFNHKTSPPVRVDVIEDGEDISREALESLLSALPAPVASITRSSVPEPHEVAEDRIPLALRRRLNEEPIDGQRSEQTFAFVATAIEAGFTEAETLYLALHHPPTWDKRQGNEDAIAQDVRRCWDKVKQPGFWYETQQLHTIYRMAKRALISPWAVLANTIANVGLIVPPDCRIEAVIGLKQGSLNSAFVILGESGQGKGSSDGYAVRIPDDHKIEIRDPTVLLSQSYSDARAKRKPASGEAIPAMFVERQKQEDGSYQLVQHAYSRLMIWGEVMTFVPHLEKGSSLVGGCNSLWTGESEGTSTKGGEGQIYLQDHQARAMMIWNAQPRLCSAFLSEGNEDNGFTNRLVFFDARDKPERVPWAMPDPIEMTRLGEPWPEEFPVHESIKLEMEDNKIEGRRLGPQSHRDLATLKIAILLAVLHDLRDVTPFMWDLACQVYDHNIATRKRVKAELSVKELEDQNRRGVARHNIAVSTEQAHTRRVEKAAARYLHILRGKLGGHSTLGVLRVKNSSYRGIFDEAIQLLQDAGKVIVDGRHIRAVKQELDG